MIDDVAERTRQPGTDLDGYPELPITPEWGALVRRARSDLKISQAELASRLGVRQALISFIENGTTRSTRAVVPLVELLAIPMPKQYFDDELEERWINAGRVLRARNEQNFLALLTAAETMIRGRDQ